LERGTGGEAEKPKAFIVLYMKKEEAAETFATATLI